MIWMWGRTSPALIFFFTLHLSWHPGCCFSSRAIIQMCLTLLLPDTNLGHTKWTIYPIKSFHFHAKTMSASPCDIFWRSFLAISSKPDEDVIINDAKFSWKYLMVATEFQQISIRLPMAVYSSLILQFYWSKGTQILAASVKWTVIKLFKNRTAGEIIIKNDTRLLEIISHLVW